MFVVFCPKTHPFAYDGGKYCCKTNKDSRRRAISINSQNCENHAFTECPEKKCKDGKKGWNIFYKVHEPPGVF